MRNGKMLIVGILILAALFIFGCTAPSPSPSPSPTTPTPSLEPPKVLKVGIITALNFPMSLDMKKGIELAVDLQNKKGGLDIGGEKYNVELVVDDSKMSLETAKSAAQKQVFSDKVKFILGDFWVDSFLPIGEENKVVTIAYPPSPAIYSPDNHFCFQAATAQTDFVAVNLWIPKNFEDMKTMVGAYPDNMLGHIYAPTQKTAIEAAGMKMLDQIFYPEMATDLSALGTKVKTLNPDVFSATYGGPQMDCLALKSAYQAGYRGQLFTPASVPAGIMYQLAGQEALEGLIALAWPVEFDPPPHPVAKEFKDAYIAKYGKWDSPETIGINDWYVLKAALEQSKSVDPEKVAAVIGNGLKYESVNGSGVMVARPDMGNNRTVDTVIAVAVKQLGGGTFKEIGFISQQELIDFLKLVYGWK